MQPGGDQRRYSSRWGEKLVTVLFFFGNDGKGAGGLLRYRRKLLLDSWLMLPRSMTRMGRVLLLRIEYGGSYFAESFHQ